MGRTARIDEDGRRMGDPKRPRTRMDATLGGMLKHGTEAKQWCKVCNRTVPIDVAAWCRMLGPQTSLWDYFMPCKYEDCPDGLTAVHARTGAGTPFVPLQSYDVFRTLDRMGWEFVPKWPGQPPFGHGIE